MSCTNCFNGCSEITSDKCVKYTGVDIAALEISNGDTLYSVEQKLTTFLLSALDGTGITITLTPADVCTLVDEYLGAGTSLVDITVAIIKSVCDLQGQVDDVVADVTTLNGDYDIDCLVGVIDSSDTHLVVQAIITALCTVIGDVTALTADLVANYVQITDLNALIQSYLDSISAGTAMKDKMVPYTAMEYYGPLTYFDLTGAGTGDWDKVYLCNGNNGTPDKRGRVAVGTTTGMGGGAFDPVVDPAISGNPTYELYDVSGVNNVTLSAAELPTHTHTNTAVATQTAHSHFIVKDGLNDVELSNINYLKVESTFAADYTLRGTGDTADIGLTSEATPNINVVMTNGAIGSSESHNNIQPVLATHFIIYIPA